MKVDLANAKVFARLDLFNSITECFRPPSRFIAVDVESFTHVSVERLGRNVNRTLDHVQQHAQAARVIAVLMSHQDRVETLCIFTDDGKSADDLFCAQTRIDEYASVARNDQDRISC
jgi:hypothetical protein